MTTRAIDSETLRESFVYLYRSWLQSCLGERPERLALSPSDGVLVASNFVLYYTVASVNVEAIAEIRSAFTKPLFAIASELPAGILGATCFSSHPDAPAPFDRVMSLLWSRLSWLDTHSERGISNREAYETREFGRYEIWRKGTVTRLLLRPESSNLYGYVVIRNAPNDYFFRRSKSCKEDGGKIGAGTYKRCDHRVESKTFPNFDLLSDTGAVILLRLTLAGAGYKAFPRRTCEECIEL